MVALVVVVIKLFVLGFLFLYGAIEAWKRGRPLLVALMILISSFGLQFYVRAAFERQGVGFHVLDVQAWPLTVLVGDWWVLPSIAALATIGWRAIGRDAAEAYWYRTYWRFVLSLAAGVIAGTAFHVFSQVPAYTSAGLVDATWSLSMLAHDFVTYPVIVTVLLYIVPPILRRRWRQEGWIIAVLAVIFMLLMWHDATASFDPATFHPALDIRDL